MLNWRGKWWTFMFLPLALVLWPLVAYNYRLRSSGVLPDEWYWADRMLWKIGYAVTRFV